MLNDSQAHLWLPYQKFVVVVHKSAKLSSCKVRSCFQHCSSFSQLVANRQLAFNQLVASFKLDGSQLQLVGSYIALPNWQLALDNSQSISQSQLSAELAFRASYQSQLSELASCQSQLAGRASCFADNKGPANVMERRCFQPILLLQVLMLHIICVSLFVAHVQSRCTPLAFAGYNNIFSM